MHKYLLAIGATLLLHSCAQVEEDIKKIDLNKLEQIVEEAVEDVAEEVIKDQTGVQINLKKDVQLNVEKK
jgi:hypothetical protein